MTTITASTVYLPNNERSGSHGPASAANSKASASISVYKVQFQVRVRLGAGEAPAVVGSNAALGNMTDFSKCVMQPSSKDGEDVWRSQELSLEPRYKCFRYKYVVV
jgi:hypothetical protein